MPTMLPGAINASAHTQESSQISMGNFSNGVGVACDGDAFFFTDYGGNAAGPDLYRLPRQDGVAAQISNATAAFSGYPLAINGDRLWRTNDSVDNDWSSLRSVRVAPKANPDAIQIEFPVAVNEGIGDLCHDGEHLWVLGNVREGNPVPNANLYRLDPETGEVLDAFANFHQCPRGRPAGLACDGPGRRAWLFCFAEDGQNGSLAEFLLPVTRCDACECGNEVLEPGEDCDDGNDLDSDGCLSDCTIAECGDGQLWVGEEQCDDGNDVDGDACRNDCTEPRCGDGIQDADEECDDANEDETDDCLSSCEAARCGDGELWAGEEQCDDGNAEDGDACPNTCIIPGCGNGMPEGDEECDDGNDDNTDDCVFGCLTATCGDGYQHAEFEACDDGNRQPGDGCDADCNAETPEVLDEVVLAAEWASVRSDFHPNSACFDETTGTVALMIQSRPSIQLVDPVTGLRAGDIALPEAYNRGAGVACDGDFYFTDYNGQGGGPDLFRVSRPNGQPMQISAGVAAVAGYPLTVHGDTLWRTNDSNQANWSSLRTIRVSNKATPDEVTAQFDVAVPEGIGDLCHDGVQLWALGYVHEGAPNPNASLYRIDATTGEVRDAFGAVAQCPRGRPAGLACDGSRARGWIYCFDEAQGDSALVTVHLPISGPCPECVCGNGIQERGETCDDGNREDDDGCSPACQREGPGPGEAPQVVAEVALDEAWAGVHGNFHPQGACYHADADRVAMVLQGRSRIDFVDPETGALDGGLSIAGYASATSVGCGDDAFYFADYTGNRAGPDLFRVQQDDRVGQISRATEAFAGYPLTVHDGTMWRGIDSRRYDWSNQRSLRVSTAQQPDNVTDVLEVAAPNGIGDLCHDGEVLWALGYVDEGDPSPEADLLRIAPESGLRLDLFEAAYTCPTGRPATLACDGETGRMWISCYDEEGGEGTLATLRFAPR